MKLSTVRSGIGPVFSLIGVGFFLPVYFTSPPANAPSPDPYPPVLNGWQALISLPVIGPILAFVLLMAVMLLSSSLLLLFQKWSLLVTRTRLLLSFSCMALLVFDSLYSWLLNFNDEPHRIPSPTFAFGRGFWVSLAGLAVWVRCGKREHWSLHRSLPGDSHWLLSHAGHRVLVKLSPSDQHPWYRTCADVRTHIPQED